MLLTNHHVAFEALVNASDQTKDYATNGYMARNRAEELPAKNYTVSITQEIKDVTSEVLSGISDTTPAPERTAAIQNKVRAMQTAAARPPDGITAQVLPLNEGLSYYMFTYLVLRDVRIVYAPPKSIGFFGGDPDNFEWPRHCGDFTFMRSHVSHFSISPSSTNKYGTVFGIVSSDVPSTLGKLTIGIWTSTTFRP